LFLLLIYDYCTGFCPVVSITFPINNGAKTKAVVDIVVIMTCSEGPAVSLNGSPTVSPVIAA
jgi:hypothetical protein